MTEITTDPKPTEVGFQLKTALFHFLGFALVVLILGELIIHFVWPGGKILLISSICGASCILAGIFSLIMTYYWRKKYGVGLVEIMLGAGLRTGIPLVVALVFFFILDNNIFNKAIFALAGYYFIMFAYNVRLTIPTVTRKETVLPFNDSDGERP